MKHRSKPEKYLMSVGVDIDGCNEIVQKNVGARRRHVVCCQFNPQYNPPNPPSDLNQCSISFHQNSSSDLRS